MVTAVALLIASVAGAGRAEPVKVVVHLGQAYSVNGHTELQRNVFGLTAYEGATIPALPEERRVLIEPGVTCLGFPGLIGWCCPTEPPAGGIDELVRWYESEEAERMLRDRPLNGDRYMYGRILPGCREIGIEPMVYLLGGPPWMMGPEGIPLNNEEYARVVVAYVGLLRRFDPQLRLFHLDNEPNAHWFRANQGGPEYAALFTTVARALHARYPDARIGGPVLCWPPAWPPAQTGQRNWYTWDSYTLPLIEAAGDQLDFFDFHLYDFTLDQALEEITVLENELRLRRGREVPILITESGLGMTEAEWRDPAAHWRKRTVPWERHLLALLEHPDKVESNQMHDVGAVAGEWFRFLGSSDPADQPPTYWLYWVLRHLRGTRLCVSQSPGAPLHAIAATEGRRAAVVLFNDSGAEEEVETVFAGATAASGVRCDQLHLQGNGVVRSSGEGPRFTIPPQGTVAAWVELPEPPRSRVAAERLEFFGESTMNEFAGGRGEVSVVVTLPAEALRGATAARARVGTLGNAEGESLSMRLDGREYPLRGGTYFQEVPLGRLPRPGRHDVAFVCESADEVVQRRPGDHRLMVSSVTLVVERNR